MKINAIRSDVVYQKMMYAPVEKRPDIYRHELMKPFEFKWACINVPMKAAQKGGYDVVMASEMMGIMPPARVSAELEKDILNLGDQGLWKSCEEAIRSSLTCFENANITLPVQDYVFTLLLANPESPYTIMSEGYSGDGGIPGYIMGYLVPEKRTIQRMPVALAHECNHNVRFQFQKWHPDITLGDMLVSEGLAENFAVSIYSQDFFGPWITKTDMETLNSYIKPLMHDALGVTGFDGITPWLYGDETAKLQNFFPVGMPYCAGYACGYHLIQFYLKKTGLSIEQATLQSAEDILAVTNEFWEVETVF